MDFKIIFTFLKSIKKNNNREWFEKNKPKYITAKTHFEDFLEALHAELVKFDESLAGLNPRKQGFRIYRDVRFSKDKRPYKINMGAGFSEHGKMDQEPGYYIHIEPGNCFIAGGFYMPDAEKLSKIRQEIDYNAHDFLKIINDKKFKKSFPVLDDFDKLKTAPKGYPKDHPNIELLKHKSYVVTHQFNDKEVLEKNFIKNAAGIAKLIKSLNDFLKQAVA
jgi:uncharacterized protein (TIGR02453 family)